MTSIPSITVQELKAKLDRGDFRTDLASQPRQSIKDHPKTGRSVLLDVREPKEHQLARLPQAVLMPMSMLGQHLQEFDDYTEYVVMCKVGVRSAQVVQWLGSQGYRAVNLTGGISAWSREIDGSVPLY